MDDKKNEKVVEIALPSDLKSYLLPISVLLSTGIVILTLVLVVR